MLLKNERRKDGEYEKQNQTDFNCVFCYCRNGSCMECTCLGRHSNTGGINRKTLNLTKKLQLIGKRMVVQLTITLHQQKTRDIYLC